MNKDTIFNLKEYDKAYQWCLENEDYTIEQIEGTKNYHFVVKEEIINKDTYSVEQRKFEIQTRLSQLSQDFVQAIAGAYFEDFETRKAEFQTLHNELRVLEGKKPREYNTQNSLTNT